MMWKILTVSLAICLPLVPATPVSLGKFDVDQYLALVNDINSDADLSPRIIGGEEVTPHSYPSQAALLITVGKDAYFCGGSLISNRWVLTSARCLTMEQDYIYVVLGAHSLTDVEPPVVIMNATSYICHEDFDSDTFQNDVGLLKLPEEVTFTDNIQPTILANGTDTYEGDNGTIVGWGATETSALSFGLMKIEVPIITNDECADADDHYKEILQPTELCTSGEDNVGICNGDNGGPLFVDDVQVGIVSFGTANCSLGLPSVFTKVNDYYDWIMDTIESEIDTTVTPSPTGSTDPTTDAPGGAAGLDSLRLGVIVLVALYFAQLLK